MATNSTKNNGLRSEDDKSLSGGEVFKKFERRSMSKKSQPRIAHIMPWTALGGTEISQLRIAQALQGKHFNSIFFCLPGEHPTRKLFAEAGFKTATFEAVEPSYRRPRKFLIASFKLRKELKRFEIDLVHCSDIGAAHYTAIAGRLARLPVISHVRNP